MHTGTFCMKEQMKWDSIKLAWKCEFICFKIIPENNSIYKCVGASICDRNFSIKYDSRKRVQCL